MQMRLLASSQTWYATNGGVIAVNRSQDIRMPAHWGSIVDQRAIAPSQKALIDVFKYASDDGQSPTSESMLTMHSEYK